MPKKNETLIDLSLEDNTISSNPIIKLEANSESPQPKAMVKSKKRNISSSSSTIDLQNDELQDLPNNISNDSEKQILKKNNNNSSNKEFENEFDVKLDELYVRTLEQINLRSYKVEDFNYYKFPIFQTFDINSEEHKKAVTLLSRFILFRGTKNLPITNNDINEILKEHYKTTKLNFFAKHYLGHVQHLLLAKTGYLLISGEKINSDRNIEMKTLDKHFYLVNTLSSKFKIIKYLYLKKNLANCNISEGFSSAINIVDESLRGLLFVIFNILTLESDNSVEFTALINKLNLIDSNIYENPKDKTDSDKIPAFNNKTMKQIIEIFIDVSNLLLYYYSQ